MRAPALVALAIVAAVGFGCQESGFDEARETAKPLKVQHVLGEAKVPGRAERPITLSANALDDTLALGVRPLRAALPGARVPPYLRSRSRGADVVGPVTAPDLAAIEAAAPDLILGSVPPQGRLYQRLRRIAPTVMSEAAGVQWKLNARLHGEALGRTNDAERLLVDYDRRSGRLREKLSDRAPRIAVSVVRVLPGGLWMAGEQSFAGSVIGDLGLARPPAQDGPREYETVAPEQVPALDGDLLLLSVAPGAEDRLRGLESSPEWRGLRGVRSGRVLRVDDGTWWSGGGILAARAALRDVERALGG